MDRGARWATDHGVTESDTTEQLSTAHFKMKRWHGMGRGGRGIQDGEHVYTRGGFMLMYGKTNTIL